MEQKRKEINAIYLLPKKESAYELGFAILLTHIPVENLDLIKTCYLGLNYDTKLFNQLPQYIVENYINSLKPYPMLVTAINKKSEMLENLNESTLSLYRENLKRLSIQLIE